VLYESLGSLPGTSSKYYPVIVSFIKNRFDVYVADQYITTFMDSSLSTGAIGIGVGSSEYNSAIGVFDNLVVYSSDEFYRVLPTGSSSSSNSMVATGTPRSVGKVVITVVNNSSQPQEVYCEGIYIFTIGPREQSYFRFQQGNWRIDTCYPGTYPCNNGYYVDLNYETVTYTISD